MKLYHGTSRIHADAIIKEGFQDRTGTYMLSITLTGVWFGNQMLDENEGAKSEAYFIIDIPESLLVNELIEEGREFREWCIPAELANRYFSNREIWASDIN